MSYGISIMMKILKWTVLAPVVVASMAGQANSAPIAVVPGSVAGYLYLPAANAGATNTVTVNFVKEGSFKNYSISSTPAGLVCDNKAEQCSAQLTNGTSYEFKVTGQYATDLYVVPTWSGDCDATESLTCANTVSANDTVKVAVEALSSTDLTPVLVKGKVKARYLYQMADSSYLVATTENILRAKAWQAVPTLTGGSDSTDGRQNMSKITGSDYIAHCQGGLPTEMGGDWYWPSVTELRNIDITNWMKIVAVKELWSSTEADQYNASKRNMENGEAKSESKTKTDRNALCVKRFY